MIAPSTVCSRPYITQYLFCLIIYRLPTWPYSVSCMGPVFSPCPPKSDSTYQSRIRWLSISPSLYDEIYRYPLANHYVAFQISTCIGLTYYELYGKYFDAFYSVNSWLIQCSKWFKCSDNKYCRWLEIFGIACSIRTRWFGNLNMGNYAYQVPTYQAVVIQSALWSTRSNIRAPVLASPLALLKPVIAPTLKDVLLFRQPTNVTVINPAPDKPYRRWGWDSNFLDPYYLGIATPPPRQLPSPRWSLQYSPSWIRYHQDFRLKAISLEVQGIPHLSHHEWSVTRQLFPEEQLLNTELWTSSLARQTPKPSPSTIK